MEGLVDSMEENVAEEMEEEGAEEEEEVEEEPEAAEPRKSKSVASRKDKGKGKVVHPKNPKKKKDLPKLEEVHREKRKLLETFSVTAKKAKIYSFFLYIFFF